MPKSNSGIGLVGPPDNLEGTPEVHCPKPAPFDVLKRTVYSQSKSVFVAIPVKIGGTTGTVTWLLDTSCPGVIVTLKTLDAFDLEAVPRNPFVKVGFDDATDVSFSDRFQANLLGVSWLVQNQQVLVLDAKAKEAWVVSNDNPAYTEFVRQVEG